MQTHTEFNGRVGTMLGFEGGRYFVRLDVQNDLATVMVKLKASNVRLRSLALEPTSKSTALTVQQSSHCVEQSQTSESRLHTYLLWPTWPRHRLLFGPQVSPLGEETSAEADGAAADADADADASPRQSVHSDATQPPPPPPRWGSARPRKARRDTDAEVNKERQEVKPVVAPVRSLRRAHLQPNQQTQGCARRTWTDGHTLSAPPDRFRGFVAQSAPPRFGAFRVAPAPRWFRGCGCGSARALAGRRPTMVWCMPLVRCIALHANRAIYLAARRCGAHSCTRGRHTRSTRGRLVRPAAAAASELLLLNTLESQP